MGFVDTPKELVEVGLREKRLARREAFAARDVRRALAALALLDARALGRNRPTHPKYLPKITDYFAREFGFHPSNMGAWARGMRKLLESAPDLEGALRCGELGFRAAQKEQSQRNRGS